MAKGDSIIHYHTETASSTPSAGDLSRGELAINLPDKKIFVKDHLDAVVELTGGGGGDVVTDTSPQLGGDLDVNGNDLVSVSNGDINITPNGTGKTVITNLEAPLQIKTTQTGDYTGVFGDESILIPMSHATGSTFTIPAEASVNYAIGTQIHIMQVGAGATTIAINGGDTLDVNSDLTAVLDGQMAIATAIKMASATWSLVGHLVAAAGAASEFADDVFRIQDNIDATKEIAFQATGVGTGTVKTITMPNADVDLTNVNSALQDITSEALSTLSDVIITSNSDGETLRWNGSAWINNTLAELGVATAAQGSTADSALQDITGEPLSALFDVTITGNSDGETLRWNGSAWINNTLAELGVATAAQGTTADSAVQPGGALGTPSSGVATNLTGTASGLTAGAATTLTSLTASVAELNSAADLSGLTAGWVYSADTATTASWKAQTGGSGDPDQNIYETIIGDTGSTTASTITDTLDIEGGTGITTTASTDKLSIAVDATQAGITSAASLATVGTIGTGVWQGTPVATAYIADEAVTHAKLAHVATGSVLGRTTAATGDVETLKIGEDVAPHYGYVDETGSAYTSVDGDLNSFREIDTGNPTLHVVANNQALLGSTITLLSDDATERTITPATNVTLQGNTKINQHEAVTAILKSTNGTITTWRLIGGSA